MGEFAIQVEGLGKKYKIGSQKSGEFRESFGLLWNKVKKMGSRRFDEAMSRVNSSTHQLPESTTPQKHDSTFWALRDINFEIKRGEAVGIIGRNGAGKSTLLKILSRITKPTTGRFEINGRVSSLLEVGTGFHKELTGRENIYLNGTILGMKRREIKQKFDEIVDFSGVEQFIDTPVKHYSSGMLVRLAFSVAAHLEPEILIIDEVLAVGDAEFQKKCLGKMEDVTGQGRTVLFVSHNMGAVKSLCHRGIVLINGMKTNDTTAEEAVLSYLYNSDSGIINGFQQNEYNLTVHPNKKQKKYGLLMASIFCDGLPSNILYPGCTFKMELQFNENRKNVNPVLGFVIKDMEGNPLIGINNRHVGVKFKPIISDGKFIITLSNLSIFRPGNYFVDLYYGDSEDNYDTIVEAFSFTIAELDYYNSGKILNPNLNLIAVPHVTFEITGNVHSY